MKKKLNLLLKCLIVITMPIGLVIELLQSFSNGVMELDI